MVGGLIGLLLLPLVLTSPSSPITLYVISLSHDGSALWTVEHTFPLRSTEEASAFEEVASTLDRLSENYTLRLTSIISEISRAVGRPMTIEDVKVESRTLDSISGKVGIIRISFLWKGFAKIDEGESISIGDALVGGFYLSDGESLRVVLPEGFELITASPEPDARGTNYVEWYGKRVFPNGEPMVLIKPSGSASSFFLPKLGDTFFLALTTASGIAAATIYLKLRTKGRRSAKESDVDVILRIIKRHGGSLYQSQIVKESGLSKSTVSTVLRLLESQGMIMRVKEGRENLVKLIKRFP